MSITFDKALGIHQDAIKLRAQRANILANNLANADTPGYKAKDLDFNEILKDGIKLTQTKMTSEHPNHFKVSIEEAMQTRYRVPLQPSVDGNTVDEQVEISQFSENSLRYMASLRFLDGKFKGLMTAIKGE